MAVVETRYLDADYRSEFSSLYSKTFAHHEDSTHRIHFFQSELDPDRLWDLPIAPGYLGFMNIRPRVRGVVGRTMLMPPERIRQAVRTAVEETVMFFGQPLVVRAVPFMQQDRALVRALMLWHGCVIIVPSLETAGYKGVSWRSSAVRLNLPCPQDA